MMACLETLRTELFEEDTHIAGYDYRRFYAFLWPIPPLLHIIYRVTLAIYVDFWLCYFVKENFQSTATDELPWLVYLTHWTYILTAVYQTSYAIVSLCHHARQYFWGHSLIYALDRRSHSALFPEIPARPLNSVGQRSQSHYLMRAHSLSLETVGQRSQSRPSVRDTSRYPVREFRRPRSVTFDSPLPWYLKAIQILLCIISPTALIVSAVYYIFLLPEGGDPFSRENLHMHFMNSVMIIVEHLINALPVKLMHVIYPVIYLLFYMLFTLLYWMYDSDTVIYPGVLNWNNPSTTLGVLLTIALVILPAAQFFFYTIYHIKVAISKEM